MANHAILCSTDFRQSSGYIPGVGGLRITDPSVTKESGGEEGRRQGRGGKDGERKERRGGDGGSKRDEERKNEEEGRKEEGVLPFLFRRLSPVLSETLRAKGQADNGVNETCPGVPLCRALWMLRGWVSFAGMQRDEPQLVHEIRRILVKASMWISLRHEHRVRQWPWRLALVADESRTMRDRALVGEDFLATRFHDLDPGFGRKFRRLVHSLPDLFTRARQMAIYFWSRNHRGHSLAAENRHASNRRCLTSQTDYKQFGARACCQEAMRSMKDACDGSEQPPPKPAHKRRQRQPAGVSVCRGVLQRFHRQCAQRDAGPGVVITSREYWEKVKAEWRSLSEEEQQAFTDLHAATLRQEVAQRRASMAEPENDAPEISPEDAAGLQIVVSSGEAFKIPFLLRSVGGQTPRWADTRQSGAKIEVPPLSRHLYLKTLTEEQKNLESAANAFDDMVSGALARDRGAIPKKGPVLQTVFGDL